jgi:RecB family exonuclease
LNVSGKIDRVDTCERGARRVIDYKSSAKPTATPENWIEKGEFQIPFYSFVVDQGLTDLPGKNSVVESRFLAVRGKKLFGGFRTTEGEGLFFDSGRSKVKTSLDEIKGLQAQTAEHLVLIAERMFQGEYLPKPLDESKCSDCQWRFTCQARHLELNL